MNNVKCFALLLVLLCGIIGLGAQTPDWQWAVNAGGTNVDWGQSIAVDGAGNQFVIGSYQGTASFGPYTLSSGGSWDTFVAKIDPNGYWLWAVRAGGTNNDYGYDIAVDGSGNAYLTGLFEGSAAFGAVTLNSSGLNDIFAAKIDPNGNWLWAVRAGGTWYDSGIGIAVDGSGNAYLIGDFQDSATFGAYTLTSASSRTNDIFTAKLDPNGNWLWAVRAGGTYIDYGKGISVDVAGNAYLTGSFKDSAAFGAVTLSSSGDDDIFAAKLDPNGYWLWAVRAGGIYGDFGRGISVDGSGNAYLTGHFAGSAAFGAFTLSSSGQEDIFTAKLDSNGNWLWAVRAGGTSAEYGLGIAVDGSGNAYLAGWFYGSAAFGAVTVSSSGSRDIFAAKLDSNGNWLWAVQAGGINYDSGTDIAVDGSGYSYLTGWFYHYADFASITLNSSGSEDIFIAKLGSGSPVDDPQNPPVTSLTLSAYPNPLRKGETATIKTNIVELGSGTLSIFNLRGQCVAVHQLSPGEQQITLDSRELPAGIYLFKLKNRDACISKKLVLLK